MEDLKVDAPTEVKEAELIEKALVDPNSKSADEVIAILNSHYKGLVFDVRTPAGMEDARLNRRKLVSFRTTGDKKRLELNKPEQEKISRRNAEWKRVEAVVVELETPIDKTIKDREAEIEQERERKREIERQRIADIQCKIDVFRNAPLLAAGKTSEQISNAIIKIGAMTCDESYQELQHDAEVARQECMEKLLDLQAKTKAAEDEAARLEAERLERERQEAEERERIRLEQEAEAKRLEAIRLGQEAAAAAEREKLAAEKAEQDRIAAEQADVLRKEREAFEQEQARLKAEAERVNSIKNLIDEIRTAHVGITNLGPDIIKRELDTVKSMEITSQLYEEFVSQAEETKATTIHILETALNSAIDRESEEKRLAEERAELKRQQEEMAETIRKQEEALADEKRRQEEEAEAARIAEEQRKQLAEGYDIILRKSSAGWLGIFNDYRTGKHHPTAAAALKAVEKYIAEQKNPALLS